MPKVMRGDDRANTLIGAKGVDDYIHGFGGNDTLVGLSGDDTLNGGTGDDTMKGGFGDDTYYVDSQLDTVVEYEGEGKDLVITEVTYNVPTNVEDMILHGAADIDGYGNSLDNTIYGNSGDNHIYGGGGRDTLLGGKGNDQLFGGTGDDTLNGGSGADVMKGGLDNDTYYTDGADTIIEGKDEGWDTVFSGVTHGLAANVEALTLQGSANIDGAGNELENVLTGNSGNNMLFGYDGADTLNGGTGADSLYGGDGDDIYYVDGHEDHVFEHADEGVDRVYSSANHWLADNVEILQLTGNAFVGQGNSIRNTIVGNDVDNLIDGCGSNDDLTGGGGNDSFYFRAGEANGDAIYDFSGNGAAVGDRLVFAGYGPGATFEQVTATEWRIASADGSIQETIVLIGEPTIDASDYVFV